MTLRLANENDTPARVRVALTAWQRMEVEAVRKLIIDLEAIDGGQLAGPLGAYWAGRLEAAARNLLDIIDAVVQP